MSVRKPDVGDWVRFQRAGMLVIGVVEYVKEANSATHRWEITTDAGTVWEDSILETRKASR